MPTSLLRYPWATTTATVAAVTVLNSNGAQAAARTPSISGNGWVALGIIAFLVWGIYMLIRGAMHLERRDASLGRRRRTDDGWFGIFPAQSPDEEDAPDFHHHDDGGGEGGEAGGN
jgi:hypothetical protein